MKPSGRIGQNMKGLEVYSELYQTSKMDHFTKMVTGFYASASFVKLTILDVWPGSVDGSEDGHNFCQPFCMKKLFQMYLK